MDSPCLIRLGFLLVAITAPHPDIAMASDHPAEGTPDSSLGQTKVTVYCCEACATSICQARDFRGFAKIAETQNETFSNGTIKLMTRQTHILMCFQQANTFPEGIYAIVWEKTGGAGYSCGNPNSTAFSEDRTGYISTEEDKTCCEVDTNIWEPNPTLKCYMSGAESRKPPAATPVEGIPSNLEFLTNKERHLGISLTLPLLFVLCAAITIRCFCRRHQYNQAQAKQTGSRV